MAYFRNRTVNLLNLHYAIHSIALTGGGAFFAVYMLKAGVALPFVFLAFAAILIGRFAIRPLIIPFAVRFGLRALVIAGTILSCLQYPLLAEVHGMDAALFAMCLVAAIADTVYWSGYHAYFAALGDDEHRGHQIGIREAITALVGIVSPLATAGVLVAFGARVAFGATTVVVLLAALPLLWTPNVAVAREAPGAIRAALPGVAMFICDGWIGAGFVFVWQIALFVSLGESFVGYGGALAIAAVVAAVAGLFLGRHIDAGHGGRAVWLGVGSLVTVVLVRAAVPGHPALAVIANALGALPACLYIPTLMTAVYNQAKRSPCALRFHVATEGGWDIGGGSACLLAALFAWLGWPISYSLLLPLVGAATVFVLLRRYYAAIGISEG
jgi:DHA1 family inner membrane transport protein